MDDKGFISIEYLFSLFIILIIALGMLFYASSTLQSSLNIEDSATHRLILDNVADAISQVNSNGEGYSKYVQTVSVNPHLLHWTNSWKNSPFTKEENELLLSKVNKLKAIHKSDLKTKMLLTSMTTAIEAKIQISKE